MTETSKRCGSTALYVEYIHGKYVWKGTGAFASVLHNPEILQVLNNALTERPDSSSGMTS